MMAKFNQTTIVPRCRAYMKRDCFAEPVIGPAKGRTRWLAMTLSLLSDLMLRRPRSGRLEAWAATRGPSFETHRFAMLLRIRQKEGARSATKQSPPPGWESSPQGQAPMAPGQSRVWAKRTRARVLAKRTRGLRKAGLTMRR